MTQIVADAEMARQLAAAEGQVTIVDGTGTVIAVCTPVKFPHSPFTDEEIEEARKSPNSGITLAEFWEKVKRGEWR